MSDAAQDKDAPTSLRKIVDMVTGFLLEPGLVGDPESGQLRPTVLLGLQLTPVDIPSARAVRQVHVALRPDLLPQLAQAFAHLAQEWPRLEPELQRLATKTPPSDQRLQ